MTQHECVHFDHVLQMNNVGYHKGHRPSSIREPPVESATSITVQHETTAAWWRKRVRSGRARPPRRRRSPPLVRAPLAGASAGIPSPPPYGRGLEWPRASTDAATGGDRGTVSVAPRAAGAVGRSGTSAAALLPLPGRVKMRGQKAGAGGSPAAARRLRTWRRRVTVMN